MNVTERLAPLFVATAFAAVALMVAAVLQRVRSRDVAPIPTSTDPAEVEAYWRDYNRRQQETSRRYARQIPIFILLVGLFVSLLQLV